MVVGLGVGLFTVVRMKAEVHDADPGFTRQLFTQNEIARCADTLGVTRIRLSAALARGVAPATLVLESSS